MIFIQYKRLFVWSLTLLLLPLLIFSFGWMRWEAAIVCEIICVWLFFRMVQYVDNDSRRIGISYWGGVTLVVGTSCLIWISGIGGFFPQSVDYFVRNALYRDLLLHSWPVFYESTSSVLVYYFGYWLPPALLGKVGSTLFSEYELWLFGQGTLVIWSFIYLITVFLNLLFVVEKCFSSPIKTNTILKVIFVFFSFGGLSVLGYLVARPLNLIPDDFPNLYEAYFYNPIFLDHFSERFTVINNNITQLMNVFNQFLPAWLATLIFLNNKEIRFYCPIIAFLLLAAPFPAVGLCWMMLVSVLFKWYRNEAEWESVFSLENMLAVIPIFFVGAFFEGGAAKFFLKPILTQWHCITFFNAVVGFLTVSILTVGIYGYCIISRIQGKESDGEKSFLCVVVFLFVATFFIGIGSYTDFAMRASCPMVFYFTIECIKLIQNEKKRLRLFCIICLCISGMTPILILRTHVLQASHFHTLRIENDTLYTIPRLADTVSKNLIEQYARSEPKKYLFWNYFSKVDVTNDSVKKALDASNWNQFEDTGERPLQLSIIWRNFHNYISRPYGFGPPLAVEVLNLGMESISVGIDSENKMPEELRNGIAIELYDKDKKLYMYPGGFDYTHRSIQAGGKGFYVLFLTPVPSGEYYIKFVFFYTDKKKGYQRIGDNQFYHVFVE